jgi:hypothetical protein
MTTGEPLFDEGGCREPADVAIFGDEDDAEEVWLPRFLAAGGDRSRLHVHDEMPGDPPRTMELPGDSEWLYQVLVDRKVKLCVFDPVLDFLSGDTKSSNDKSVRRALKPLSKVASRAGCAALAIQHINKDRNATAANRASGSHQFMAVYRSALMIVPCPDEPNTRVVFPTKATHSEHVNPFRFDKMNDPARDVPVICNIRPWTGAGVEEILQLEIASSGTSRTGDRYADKIVEKMPPGACYGVPGIKDLLPTNNIDRERIDKAVNLLVTRHPKVFSITEGPRGGLLLSREPEEPS